MHIYRVDVVLEKLLGTGSYPNRWARFDGRLGSCHLVSLGCRPSDATRGEGAMTHSLGSTVVRGSAWLAVVTAVAKGSQVVITIALAKFLDAPELGVVAITLVIFNLAQIAQAAGVYDVIARTTHDPIKFAGTAATISVGFAVVCSATVLLTAHGLAVLLGSAAAEPLMRVTVLGLPFAAYGGVQRALVHRDLNFRRRLIPDAGSAAAGAAVTIAFAWGGFGPWAVVIGILTTSLLMPLLGMAVGIRIPFAWHRPDAVTCGKWMRTVGPAALVGFAVLNIDYVVVSRTLGESATGIYALAYRIAFVPYITVAIVLGGVAFPVYAMFTRSARLEELPQTFEKFVHAVVALAGGLYLVIALCSTEWPSWVTNGFLPHRSFSSCASMGC